MANNVSWIRKGSALTHSIDAEIIIEAPPERVWGVLTDLPRYREWNPFIEEAAGEAAPGRRLRLRMRPPGGRATTFKPTVQAADGHEFRWLGHLLVKGLFDGEHRFTLEPTNEGGTRVVQGERFSGALVPLLRRSLDDGTLAGFRAMNEALKRRVEA